MNLKRDYPPEDSIYYTIVGILRYLSPLWICMLSIEAINLWHCLSITYQFKEHVRTVKCERGQIFRWRSNEKKYEKKIL